MDSNSPQRLHVCKKLLNVFIPWSGTHYLLYDCSKSTHTGNTYTVLILCLPWTHSVACPVGLSPDMGYGYVILSPWSVLLEELALHAV